MAKKPVSITAKQEEFCTAEIAQALSSLGWVWAPIEALPLPIDRWREAARAAGRTLGRPVRTEVHGDDCVHVWLADWPANDDEEDVMWEQVKEIFPEEALRVEQLHSADEPPPAT